MDNIENVENVETMSKKERIAELEREVAVQRDSRKAASDKLDRAKNLIESLSGYLSGKIEDGTLEDDDYDLVEIDKEIEAAFPFGEERLRILKEKTFTATVTATVTLTVALENASVEARTKDEAEEKFNDELDDLFGAVADEIGSPFNVDGVDSVELDSVDDIEVS